MLKYNCRLKMFLRKWSIVEVLVTLTATEQNLRAKFLGWTLEFGVFA